MRRIALAVVLGIVAAGCGGALPEQRESSDDPRPAAEASWNVIELGEVQPQDSAAVAVGGFALVGTGSEIAGWALDGEPVAVATSRPESVLLTVAAGAAGASGLLAVGSDYDTFLPVVWRSDDGRSWAPGDTSGLEQPGDMTALVATSEGYVSVGAFRTGKDPSGGPFAAAVWRSEDGRSWETIELPVEAGRDSYGSGIVAVGETLVAVGQDGRRAAVWRSADGGATWTRSTPPALEGGEYSSLQGIAAHGETLLAAAAVPTPDGWEELLLLVSHDKGQTWDPVELPADLRRDLGAWVQLGSTSKGFWAISYRGAEIFRDLGRCYDDLEYCRAGSRPVLLHSPDGLEWNELDLGSLAESQYLQLLTVTEDPVGRLAVVAAVEAGMRLSAWSDPESLPPPAPVRPEPPRNDIPLADHGAELEVGVVYRFPLFIHCGMDYLGSFNDRYWYLRSAPGSVPEAEWPTVEQSILGFVRLVDTQTIEYSIPSGEVIAIYAPSDREPPGCA
jgi:hypothetical protein